MTHAAPTSAEPAPSDPRKDRPVLCMPGYLAAVLQTVRVLLAYGRRMMETVEPRSRHIQFATIASVFGTESLDMIFRRLERGILRAIALERYLIARAARRRDLKVFKRRINGQPVGFTDPPQAPEHTPEKTTRAKPRSKPEPDAFSYLSPDDPQKFHAYSVEQLEAQVRSWPVGRSIAEICNDLGIVSQFCTLEFWNDVYQALYWYGGSYTVMWKTQKRRETEFAKQRDGRPDVWAWDWRDRREERVRRALGCLIGEAPLMDPTPDMPLATAPP